MKGSIINSLQMNQGPILSKKLCKGLYIYYKALIKAYIQFVSRVQPRC